MRNAHCQANSILTIEPLQLAVTTRKGVKKLVCFLQVVVDSMFDKDEIKSAPYC